MHQPRKPNQPFLISLLALLALPSLAGETEAEQQLKWAKEAYAQNRCGDAIVGFRNYLKQAEPATEKRNAILSAISWCEKQEKKRMASRQMEFVGAAAPRPGPVLHAAPSAPAPEEKPATP